MTVTPPQPGSGKSRRCNGHKDTRLLLEAVEAAGGECVPHGRTRPGHWKVYLDGKMIGGISGTPSDHRTRKNDIARLRRNGLNITSKGTYDGAAPQDRP